MDIDQFSDEVQLHDRSELDRVRLIAYFFLRTQDKVEFNGSSIIAWFDALHMSRPNMSRLSKKMRSSPVFVSRANSGVFKLHGKEIRSLDEAFRDRLSVPEAKLLRTQKGVFVDLDRLGELRSIKSPDFDLTKLIELCEELNAGFKGGCLHSIIMLTRAIIDHVPPVLGCKTFSEVANNYSGSRSFKASMQNLDRSSRKIADQHLHTPIRSKETLPNIRQVDFSSEIDVLLAELVRTLK